MLRKLSKFNLAYWGLSGLISSLLISVAPKPVCAATLRVGTKPFAPFAFVQEGEYIGFSIDLWAEIAQELELDYGEEYDV